MDTARKKLLVAYLAEFVSAHKKQRIEQVLGWRTRHLTLVLEDLYQPHNASAVLRSCDCFGVQDVHIIESRNPYTVNPDVALGASKWLTLIRHNQPGADNTRACIETLRQRGYRIVAASPNQDDCLLDELPVQGRLAVMFGTEEEGLSPGAMEQADEYVKIPMYGFTPSFNISVSAALIMAELTGKIRTADLDWGLTEAEKLALRLNWYRETIRGSDLIEQRFWAERGESGSGSAENY